MSKEQFMIWWKDRKLLVGFILVILSLILGTYGKLLFIIKIYEPISVITGLSLYAFSWILLFIGVSLLGWETIKIIRNRIHSQVKKTVRETYHYTKKLPKKGYNYTRELHKKSMAKIRKSIKK